MDVFSLSLYNNSTRFRATVICFDQVSTLRHRMFRLLPEVAQW